MKKNKNTGFIIIFLVATATTQTQAQYYASKDFEHKGVTEYLFLYWGNTANYWTNTNKKTVPLKVLKADMRNPTKGYFYTVSFAKSKQKYKLHQDFEKKQLVCTHPNGKQQRFTELPTMYVSKDFERKGMTEYLQNINGKLCYYTSANAQKKIPLVLVKHAPGQMKQVYRFPNSQEVYTIEVVPICLGGLICTLPDGRKQFFTRYNWKD